MSNTHTVSLDLPMVIAWAGATSAWIGVMVASGYAVKTRKAKTVANTVEVCQCEHGASYHDGAGCKFVIEEGRVTRYNSIGEAMRWEPAACACVRYVGPNTSYLPEIDGPASPLNQL